MEYLKVLIIHLGQGVSHGLKIKITETGWQFGVSVNIPDNQAAYDGIHDDKDRAELNLGVAGYQPFTADIAGFWPGACESNCVNEDWSMGYSENVVVTQVWHRRAICGNGQQEGDEPCDDGNTVDGDGCSSTCISEILVGQ